MTSDIVLSSEEYVKKYFDSNHDPNLVYHNIDHTSWVVNAIKKLSAQAELDQNEIDNLVIAAWFHDLGYINQPFNHEQESVKLASDYLTTQGVKVDRIEQIADLIKATKLDWQGDDFHSLLLRDADLSHLAAKNYAKVSEKLRIEHNNFYDKKFDLKEWIDHNISFFNSHSYHTSEGKSLYKKKKKKNLEKLKSSKKTSNDKSNSLSASKIAQTQLKTTLRNHIDLSAIADNKANIMISINVIMSTVGLPLMFNILNEYPNFIIPLVILSLTGVSSLIFATLSTRPIKMKGLTDLKDISSKKTNLFFFGNFYKMPFEEYEKGLTKTISDSELLENSIARDLFTLGKSLGKKYHLLRISYNVFMIGISLTILSFIFVIL